MSACRCTRACEMPCWQRVGIAPPCSSCGCEQADLVDCPYCRGEGEIFYNPSRIGDPQWETSAPCPTCRGAGTVERRSWDITVCVLCLEHVNDCRCDLDGWTGPEPPTLTLTVGLEEAGDRITYAVDTAEGALDGRSNQQ